MAQLVLMPVENRIIDLPPLMVGPVGHSIGQIRHILSPGGSCEIIKIGEVQVSPRRREPLYQFPNGERVVVTPRRLLMRPAEADGVLWESGNSGYRWLHHRRVQDFKAAVTADGWAAVAKRIADGWDGKFAFRAEEMSDDGNVAPGKEGLRPPQLGALHAIGAHWSLSHLAATVVMPTGTGKTETMLSALAAYIRGPLLVVVPSDILRTQTARKFLSFGLLRQLGVLASDVANPIVGVITRRPQSLADLDILTSCNVVVTTMSAIGEGSAAALAPEIARRVRALIVDEAHHIGADGWTRFREAFSERPVLQFTATPFRRDGRLVDGVVVYDYPLRMAQRDGYFKKISFAPVYEIDATEGDRQIAETAVAKLREDLAAGLNHLIMARCASIPRATDVHAIYQRIAPDFNPMLVHSELTDTDTRLRQLRSGESRIVVCVNMLGEGFDLPELKIAAVHDLHKSLAILLQFTGRFTRSTGDRIGDATFVANIADPDLTPALERLYSEDADWNQVLSELSSDAARDHAELVEFLNSSQRLDDAQDDDTTAISHHLLRPNLSTLMYEAQEFRPKRFHEGFPKELQVHRVWLNEGSNTLFFVTKTEPSIKWTRSKALRDRQWALFILHFNPDQRVLYLSSSDHSSLFEKLAAAVGGTKLISGDVIFRSLGRINRLIFQNMGLRKHGRRNLRYAMYTGADVAEALTLSERAGSVKSNLSGTGWEDGKPTTIGCSYKGRVWSREQGPVPRFVKWCANVGAKIIDETIDTRQIIANVLIPEEQERLPEKQVLGLEWPIELLWQSEERVVLTRDELEAPLSMFDIQFVATDADASALDFALFEAGSGNWVSLRLIVGGDEGFKVLRRSDPVVLIRVGSLQMPIEEYLSNYPPMVRFVDLTELDGNLLIRPQEAQDLTIPEERFEVWDWNGVDLAKESIWREGAERRDSIQWHAAQHFIDGGFDVVFDDDAPGEAADLVCLKEEADHIQLALVHCKFSGGADPGERVKDVVEVCSQAVRSAKWKWKFRDLCRHIVGREKRMSTDARPTRFLAGHPSDLNRFLKVSRFKDIRPAILIAQPGLSQNARSREQSAVLASALSYLKQTIGVDLDIICSD
jgi:superfamily II DNA or RNA helicase